MDDDDGVKSWNKIGLNKLSHGLRSVVWIKMCVALKTSCKYTYI